MINLSVLKGDKFRVNFVYAAVQSCYWGAFCIYFSFLVAYLAEQGYSNSLIGLIMTFVSIATTITPSIIGYLADFYIPLKRIAVSFMLISIPAAFLLPITVNIFPLALSAILVMAICQRSLTGLIDSWASRIYQQKPYLNYGITRGIASLFFAVTALVFGQVLENIGLNHIFWIHAIFALLTAIFMMLLDNAPICAKPTEPNLQKQSYALVIKELLANKKYLQLIISMTLFGIAISSTITFLPILMKSIGGDNGDVGLLFFVIGLSEFPVMMLFSRLIKKFKAYQLLRFAYFIMIFRLISNVLVADITFVIIIQCLQGLAFALFQPAVLIYISDIVDNKIKASAITLAFALKNGLSGIIGNLLGGYMADYMGINYVFIVFSLFTIAGFLLIMHSTKDLVYADKCDA